MNDNKFYHKYTISQTEIDYFWDGENMMIFGTENLDKAGIKLSGIHIKKMREQADKTLAMKATK